MMRQENGQTWRELLAEGQRALTGDDRVYEAWVLFEEAFQTTRSQYWLQEERVAGAEEAKRYRDWLQRRQNGEPVAYILGAWEFMGLPFKVNSSVLIPRPDTETLVEAVMEYAGKMPGLRVLDLCTGSGCIAISLAHYLQQAEVLATDISPEALAVAAENAELNRVAVTFRKGNLWQAVPAHGRYEIITANPPYIDAKQMKELDRDVREFEPHLALAGGRDGLVFYRQLAARTAEFLTERGRAFWEIGYDQGQTVAEIAGEAGLRVLEVRKDLADHDRVVLLERGKAIAG